MTQEEYENWFRAFEQGILFGGSVVFLFMLALMYALALTPTEQIEQCQSIMGANSEHTHTE